MKIIKKLPIIVASILLFCVIEFTSFVTVLIVEQFFIDAKLLTDFVALILLITICSIIGLAYVLCLIIMYKKEKFLLFIDDKISSIVSWFIIASLLSISFFYIDTIKIDDPINYISILWTIFAISVALFIYWCSIFISYINSTRFTDKHKIKGLEKIQLYSDVKIAKLRISNNQDVIIFILVNMIFICITTVFAFLRNVGETTLKYFITTSFFLSTNTITLIIISIVSYYKDLRKQINETAKSIPDNFLQDNEIFKEILIEEIEQKFPYIKEEEIKEILNKKSDQEASNNK